VSLGSGASGYLQKGGYASEVFHCANGFNRFRRTFILKRGSLCSHSISTIVP